MMGVTRYYRVLSDGMTVNEDRMRNRGGRGRRSNAGHKEIEPGRPSEIPELSWRLVASEDRQGMQDQFDRYAWRPDQER